MTQDIIGWQWHRLDHMQTICTSLQTNNHANTSSLNFYRLDALPLMPNQQRQSTEDKYQCHLGDHYFVMLTTGQTTHAVGHLMVLENL